jgi:hypothetical protein
MPLQGQERVVAIHPLAVVRDDDPPAAPVFDTDLDGRGPASRLFSTSSLTTEAGRSTTSPAAMRSTR